MNISLPLIGLLIIIGIMYNSISSNFFRTNEDIRNFSEKTVELQYSDSQYKIAKEELSKDQDWNDCEGADSLCNDYDTEYFPIYSGILGSAMENISDGNLKNTIWFEPIIKHGKAFVYSFPPIIHGKNSYNLNYDIELCSYSINENGTVDETEPTDPVFSYYIEDTNNLEKSIVINENENSKAELFVKNSITYKPEYSFDKLLATENIILEPISCF